MVRSYVDAHLHLQDKCFTNIIEAVTARAESAGVRRMFCNAVTESDWPLVTGLSRKMPAIVPFIGIHPWFCDVAAPDWQTRLADQISAMQGQTIGIGETGLDKTRAVDFKIQQQSFIDHLELAAELDLPAVIHCVKAWGPLLDTLKHVSAGRGLPRLMVHAFNGSTETMRRLVDCGCFISYCGRIADNGGTGKQKLRDTLRQTPITALMLETDAPFQKSGGLGNTIDLPTEHNEPAAVAALYQYTAALVNMNVRDFSLQLWNNAAIFTNQTVDW